MLNPLLVTMLATSSTTQPFHSVPLGATVTNIVEPDASIIAKHHDFEATDHDVSIINEAYKGILQVHSCKYGRGVFSEKAFSCGEKIMTGKAVFLQTHRDSHSVQTSWTTHAIMNLPAILINHSCNANVGIQDNEVGAFDFFALRDISPGDELVWDYEASEWEIKGFKCSCGAPNCRRELRGFGVHGDQLLKLYGEQFVARYLLTQNDSIENGIQSSHV
jgi:hypothetical protein